jgi:LacI family transcriptional regulator
MKQLEIIEIMPVTLKDIAEQSGFSITTVSRALAGYDDVNQKTRNKILAIAEKLGYQPNQVARQLQKQKTNTIGLIMPIRPDFQDDDFFSVLFKGIAYKAAHHNFDVLISATEHGEAEIEAYRRFAGGNRVDGMILARTFRNDPRIEYLKLIKHPFVVSGRSAPGFASDFPYIDYDSQHGIEQLVAHFVAYGHQHIGIILPDAYLAFSEYRFAGYRAGLEKARIPLHESYIEYGDMTYAGGLAKADALLRRNPQLTAIIGCNDLMALGAIMAVQNLGMQVGVDVAIGGFDNIPAAERATPPLTTVSQPIYELGEMLTELLIEIISDSSAENTQRLLLPQLIIRASSGKPRH